MMTILSSIPSPLLPSPSLRLPSPSLPFPLLPSPSHAFARLRSSSISFALLFFPSFAFYRLCLQLYPPLASIHFTFLHLMSLSAYPTPLLIRPSLTLQPLRTPYHLAPAGSQKLASGYPPILPPDRSCGGGEKRQPRPLAFLCTRSAPPLFTSVGLFALCSKCWPPLGRHARKRLKSPHVVRSRSPNHSALEFRGSCDIRMRSVCVLPSMLLHSNLSRHPFSTNQLTKRLHPPRLHPSIHSCLACLPAPSLPSRLSSLLP